MSDKSIQDEIEAMSQKWPELFRILREEPKSSDEYVRAGAGLRLIISDMDDFYQHHKQTGEGRLQFEARVMTLVREFCSS